MKKHFGRENKKISKAFATNPYDLKTEFGTFTSEGGLT
jgi:hypothetical protein